jgi:methanogenic corrinoid protein MtbC1
MTAEKLAARYEMGLEHDRRYDAALTEFCAQVVRPGVRASALHAFLRSEIPADQPEIVKVLFIEAVARMLGRKWVDGDCGFVDVTIGSARLQEIIRLLSFEFRSRQPRPWIPYVVLLTPVGEQHTLAQHILGLLFDAMGWSNQILEGDALKGDMLRSAVKLADIVCIGWSNQRLKKEFQDIVATIRSLETGSRTPIVAGGVAALDSVDFLVGLGIDCICDSVYSASRICEKFYELEAIGNQSSASGQRFVVNYGGPDWLSP